jgi:hypothetical protein
MLAMSEPAGFCVAAMAGVVSPEKAALAETLQGIQSSVARRSQPGLGGTGAKGGSGGNVIGNGTTVFDTFLLDDEILSDGAILFVTAGAGGSGTRRGGNGGNVLDFHPTYNMEPFTGDLSYVAGAGGNAVAGSGGTGGSIRNSSPAINALMEGDIFLEAGRGGDGIKGGGGGDITEFRIQLTANSIGAAVVSVLAGNGGFGSKNSGGSGGEVNGVDISSRGVPNFTIPILTNYAFNRILGGEGGDSARKRGGDGGDIANVRTSADQGGYAIAAGEGGDALLVGGRGGNLTNIDVTFGASTTSKGLFIAGQGGSATAFVDNPNDPNDNSGKNAFGGQVGRGGAGGNINGVTQRGNIGAHVDLIAGNGGDVVNYGTILDKKPFVGTAGSIANVNLSGDVGNITNTVGIKSYNDVLNGETVGDFVQRKLRDPFALPGDRSQ